MAEMQEFEQATGAAEESSREDFNQAGSLTDRGGKYLTFTMAEEDYGIGILKVKEIIGMQDITPVPQTPKSVKGVINLRGKVIPVVDLRLRFNMGEIEYAKRTCIIVLEISSQWGMVHIGIVVDSVSEVLNVSEHDIEDTPNFGMKFSTDYILGIAKNDKDVKMLLDMDKVLGDENWTDMESFA